VLNQALNVMREPYTDYSLNMMKWYDKYSDFASNESNKSSFDETVKTISASGSIEGIHGQYHGLIGGTAGHMSQVPVAAFDPVFWFHHWSVILQS
jgi:tyrosinase